MAIKVSIVVPVYNTEQYLSRCLDSLVGQTMGESSLEILVVDNNSTDGSAKIIKKYAREYPNLIKTLTCKKQGVSAARNVGIRAASGEFLAFVDSDDYVEVDMYAKLYAEAKRGKYDIVLCGANIIEDGRVRYYDPARVNYSKNAVKDYIVSASGPAFMITKRKLIVDNGLFFNEDVVYEDIAIVPSYVLYGENVGFVEEPLYNVVRRANSITRKEKYDPSVNDIYIALDDLYGRFRSEGKEKKYHDELEMLYIMYLLWAAGNVFLRFDETKGNFRKTRKIMKERFPKWRKNRYFHEMESKRRMFANIYYMQLQGLIKTGAKMKKAIRGSSR
ncbi:MAG: glycosyltransferase [Candidatus Saccharimonadales bacterium]